MEECLDIGAIDDILNFTYDIAEDDDVKPGKKALSLGPILPFSVLDHPSAPFPAFVEEEQEQEQEEELEWISNFPPVDEYVLAGNRGQEHQSPVSVLENSSSGGIIMSCCGSLRVPVRARSKRGRKRSFADILSQQLWWNQQSRRAASSITGRKCQHCGAEKTPQWRAGPSGPKTLCNACGVRYKSGRLVPEYRPASSPTFSSQLHSNSHRKIIEMRRQKTPVVKPVDKG